MAQLVQKISIVVSGVEDVIVALNNQGALEFIGL